MNVIKRLFLIACAFLAMQPIHTHAFFGTAYRRATAFFKAACHTFKQSCFASKSFSTTGNGFGTKEQVRHSFNYGMQDWEKHNYEDDVMPKPWWLKLSVGLSCLYMLSSFRHRAKSSIEPQKQINSVTTQRPLEVVQHKYLQGATAAEFEQAISNGAFSIAKELFRQP
jgi:hypothetical protein